MQSTMQCPVCGNSFPTDEAALLDNGNVACAECVAREKEKHKEQNAHRETDEH